MNKVIIVTPFASDNLILEYKDSYLIGVEKGAEKILNLGLKPKLVISDFDSVSYQSILERLDNELIIKLPIEKDYSDTEFAIIKAKEIFNFSDIVILGSLQGRFDHSYSLLLLLKKYNELNIILKDDYNEIHFYQKGTFTLQKNNYKYIGLFGFPFANVSLKGVYYPVENMDLYFNETRAISNSFCDEIINIDVNNGELLLVLSKDE